VGSRAPCVGRARLTIAGGPRRRAVRLERLANAALLAGTAHRAAAVDLALALAERRGRRLAGVVTTRKTRREILTREALRRRILASISGVTEIEPARSAAG